MFHYIRVVTFVILFYRSVTYSVYFLTQTESKKRWNKTATYIVSWTLPSAENESCGSGTYVIMWRVK